MSANAEKKARVMGGPGGERRRFPVVGVFAGAVVLVGIVLAGTLLSGSREIPGRAAEGGSYRLAPRRYDPAVRVEQADIV
ncbi:MAG: hypothetical protein AB1816_20385, partial [Bacillota bacterium]